MEAGLLPASSTTGQRHRRWRQLLGRAAGFVVPHAVVVARRRRLARRRKTTIDALVAVAPRQTARPFAPEDAIALLMARGLDEAAVRLGSIKPASLRFIRAQILSHFPPGTPLQALHIGNYVGVSLAALSAAALEVAPESRTVSIDPNMPHLGVADPQAHTLAMLAGFGLLHANVVVCGYTFEKTPGMGFDPASRRATARWLEEPSCENVLPSLRRLGLRFDVALMDGSHIGDYARREVETLADMLRPGGLLFLDDVSESWEEIQQLFRDATEGPLPFERVSHDGRVGVLRRSSQP